MSKGVRIAVVDDTPIVGLATLVALPRPVDLLVDNGTQGPLQVEVDGRWAGGASAPSLFARCYVQSDLPEGTKAGAKWVDERDPEFLPIYAEPGRSEEYPQVTMRLVRGDSGEQTRRAS